MQISAPNPTKVVQRSGLNFASGKGVQFNSGSLLSAYSVATWTPVDQSGASLVFTSISCAHTIIGNILNLYGSFNYPATADATPTLIAGVPITVPAATYVLGKFLCGQNGTTPLILQFVNGSTRFALFNSFNNAAITNANVSGNTIRFMSQCPIT